MKFDSQQFALSISRREHVQAMKKKHQIQTPNIKLQTSEKQQHQAPGKGLAAFDSAPSGAIRDVCCLEFGVYLLFDF